MTEHNTARTEHLQSGVREITHQELSLAIELLRTGRVPLTAAQRLDALKLAAQTNAMTPAEIRKHLLALLRQRRPATAIQLAGLAKARTVRASRRANREIRELEELKRSLDDVSGKKGG